MLKRAVLPKRAHGSNGQHQTFSESALAHRYLDGLSGVEIGGAAHNPFGLDAINVDLYPGLDTIHKRMEIQMCGKALPVDVVARGDKLPFENNSYDFVVSSHVLEHFYDPIGALKEWYRVVRNGGYILAIVPHKERTFDSPRPRTTLAELIARHEECGSKPSDDKHYNVWITSDLVELINYLGWELIEVQDTDDKVGNGFTVLIRVNKPFPGG